MNSVMSNIHFFYDWRFDIHIRKTHVEITFSYKNINSLYNMMDHPCKPIHSHVSRILQL